MGALNAIKAPIEWLIGKIQSVLNMIGKIKIPKIPGAGGGVPFIPGFAGGTRSAPGGLAVVGERGPELVNLPRGSQVIPNHQLGGGGQTILVEVYLDSKRVTQAHNARTRILGAPA